MSWQATSWALNQKVGNPARKLLLLAIAEYADEYGVCWPSQSRLARHTEASLDTVQRQTKKLVADGLLRVERPPKRRGQWQTFIYFLAMSSQDAAPQNAARPDRIQPETRPHDQAAPSPKPGRIAVRSNPSKEQLIKQPGEPTTTTAMRANKTKFSAAERKQAWQWNGAVEVIQDRIARRLGEGNSQKGWLMLMELSPDSLDFFTSLERKGALSDEMLQRAVLNSRLRSNGV